MVFSVVEGPWSGMFPSIIHACPHHADRVVILNAEALNVSWKLRWHERNSNYDHMITTT